LCSQFQTLVQVLNLFLEDLAPHFGEVQELAVAELGVRAGQQLCDAFLELLVQGMMMVRRQKPRVVR
jgi:hypothetical protein